MLERGTVLRNRASVSPPADSVIPQTNAHKFNGARSLNNRTVWSPIPQSRPPAYALPRVADVGLSAVQSRDTAPKLERAFYQRPDQPLGSASVQDGSMAPGVPPRKWSAGHRTASEKTIGCQQPHLEQRHRAMSAQDLDIKLRDNSQGRPSVGSAIMTSSSMRSFPQGVAAVAKPRPASFGGVLCDDNVLDGSGSVGALPHGVKISWPSRAQRTEGMSHSLEQPALVKPGEETVSKPRTMTLIQRLQQSYGEAGGHIASVTALIQQFQHVGGNEGRQSAPARSQAQHLPRLGNDSGLRHSHSSEPIHKNLDVVESAPLATTPREPLARAMRFSKFMSSPGSFTPSDVLGSSVPPGGPAAEAELSTAYLRLSQSAQRLAEQRDELEHLAHEMRAKQGARDSQEQPSKTPRQTDSQSSMSVAQERLSEDGVSAQRIHAALHQALCDVGARPGEPLPMDNAKQVKALQRISELLQGGLEPREELSSPVSTSPGGSPSSDTFDSTSSASGTRSVLSEAGSEYNSLALLVWQLVGGSKTGIDTSGQGSEH